MKRDEKVEGEQLVYAIALFAYIKRGNGIWMCTKTLSR
jgi:hypothetical protein